MTATAVTEKWKLLDSSTRTSLLDILLDNGIRSNDPEAVVISLDALITGQRMHDLLGEAESEFQAQLFDAICMEMCKCSNTSLRDPMISFLDVLYSTAPDGFQDALLAPFVEDLPIEEKDKSALLEIFADIEADDFKTVFEMLCDDISYPLARKNDL